MSTTMSQIAICTTDFYRSIVFYDRVVGMDDCFGTVAFRGPLAEMVQELPNPASKVRWFTDNSVFFQLEIFEFENPKPKPLPTHHSILSEGYNRLIIAVRSLEKFQRSMIELGFFQDITIVQGEISRHGITTDPDGNIIQLVEQANLINGERDAQLIGVGITSSQFEAAESDFRELFEFTKRADCFDTATVLAGEGKLIQASTLQINDKFIVLADFENSVPHADDYLLSDAGIMNFAMGYETQQDYIKAWNATSQTGMHQSVPAGDEPSEHGAYGTYATTRTNLSIEMQAIDKHAYGFWGFGPVTEEHREAMYQMTLAAVAEYKPSED